jgi:hypothetical protein
MSRYLGIYEVGNALVRILQESLGPEIIQNPDAIGLAAPDEKGDLALGLHLYDIRESDEYRATEMQQQEAGRQQYPSAYLNLCYMITSYSKADVKFRAGEDHKVLGRVVQAFHDNAILDPVTLQPVARATEMNLRLHMLNLEVEEKQRLWNFPNTPYRVSLFYKVAPVEVESARMKTVRRVVDVNLAVEEKVQPD